MAYPGPPSPIVVATESAESRQAAAAALGEGAAFYEQALRKGSADGGTSIAGVSSCQSKALSGSAHGGSARESTATKSLQAAHTQPPRMRTHAEMVTGEGNRMRTRLP